MVLINTFFIAITGVVESLKSEVLVVMSGLAMGWHNIVVVARTAVWRSFMPLSVAR